MRNNVQVTALGNPKLLERTSAGLKAIEGLFADFDLNHDQQISHEEFNQVSQRLPHRHSEAPARFEMATQSCSWSTVSYRRT